MGREADESPVLPPHTFCATTNYAHAQEHPTHGQETPTQNGSEGQKISLCDVPKTQSTTCEDARSVILPAVSCR